MFGFDISSAVAKLARWVIEPNYHHDDGGRDNDNDTRSNDDFRRQRRHQRQSKDIDEAEEQSSGVDSEAHMDGERTTGDNNKNKREEKRKISYTLQESGSEDAGETEDMGAKQSLAGAQRNANESDMREMGLYTTEGVAVARRIWNTFWSDEHKHFRTKTVTAETIGGWNGYTCWAYLIGLEAILEAERAAPGTYQKELQAALLGMEKFWSPNNGAYCAWIYFPGNGDIYLDDNAQVAILLTLAHKLLPPPTASAGFPYKSYLTRASQVVDFCLKGWDYANGGGVRWHLSTEGPPWTNRNACTTSLTAVASVELATALVAGGAPKTDPRVQHLAQWGKECVEWVWVHLVQKNLVMDGLVQSSKGAAWTVAGPTYTYNTGHTITAMVLLYDLLLPTDAHYRTTIRTRATTLVTASLDRTKSLYDTSVPNQAQRYWWDNNFFVHLLVEGLVVWGTRFGSKEPTLWNQVKAEINREVSYLMTNLRDPKDGLYWRNWRMYTISMGHWRQYKTLTGDTDRQPQLDSAERLRDEASLSRPVGERAMTKTLLGCGGAGRTLCIAGKVL